VGVPPLITSQPQSQTVFAGTNVTFSVTATGTPPLNYQWLLNGQPIGGAVGSSYSIASVQSGQAGKYTVEVSNTYGSVLSAPATLVVYTINASGVIGTPFNYQIPPISGATWYSISGQPSGLVCDNGSGLISGTPTETGLFWVSVEARNVLGAQWSVFYLFSIADPAITSATSAQGVVGVPFTYLITSDNSPGASLPTWYLASGLPPGLHHDAGSPLIYGTPTEPGTFWLSVEAQDLFGTASATIRLAITQTAVTSATNTLPVTNVVSERLTLQTVGSGGVSPNYRNAVLEVGKSYTVAATAGSGNMFSNWIGSALGNVVLVSSNPKLTFTMRSNLVLQARFIPNPFIPAAGAYQGLFYNTGGVEQASSGFFSGSVSSSGVFSAKFQQGLKSFPLSGQFSLSGAWHTNSIKGWSNTAVSLQPGLAGEDAITGSLSNAFWTVSLWANRATYSKTHLAPQAGKYTLVLPGSADAQSEPGGHGYGSASVDTSGNITFNGRLGDGTKAAQSAIVSKEGQWALYVPLYSGQGSLLGWLTFTNQADRDLGGLLNWIKPARAATNLYPAGFTNQTDAFGSRYVFTNGVRALNLTNGVLILENGNLPASLTNEFTLRTNNAAAGTCGLTLTITNATGLFQGSLTNPATGKIIKVSGAVLQKANAGYGTFLGTNQSGSVFLGPE